MTASKDSHLAELHTKAAYAHEAAAHGHSTGDHASAQELARKALGFFVEAVKTYGGIAQSASQSMRRLAHTSLANVKRETLGAIERES